MAPRPRTTDTLWLAHEGYAYRVREPSIEETHQTSAEGEVRAPMPGSVLSVHVAAGDEVKEGQTLAVVESMKMELSLTCPFDGTVARVEAKAGDRVKEKQTLVVVE